MASLKQPSSWQSLEQPLHCSVLERLASLAPELERPGPTSVPTYGPIVLGLEPGIETLLKTTTIHVGEQEVEAMSAAWNGGRPKFRMEYFFHHLVRPSASAFPSTVESNCVASSG